MQAPQDTTKVHDPTASVAPADVVVIAPEGELDLASAPALCARLAGTRAGRVLLDLSGIVFCDSAGLRPIMGAARELAIRGGRLAVVAPPEGEPARLFAVTGLEEFIAIVPDRDQGFERLLRSA